VSDGQRLDAETVCACSHRRVPRAGGHSVGLETQTQAGRQAGTHTHGGHSQPQAGRSLEPDQFRGLFTGRKGWPPMIALACAPRRSGVPWAVPHWAATAAVLMTPPTATGHNRVPSAVFNSAPVRVSCVLVARGGSTGRPARRPAPPPAVRAAAGRRAGDAEKLPRKNRESNGRAVGARWAGGRWLPEPGGHRGRV
jgi:hypothetical protein